MPARCSQDVSRRSPRGEVKAAASYPHVPLCELPEGLRQATSLRDPVAAAGIDSCRALRGCLRGCDKVVEQTPPLRWQGSRGSCGSRGRRPCCAKAARWCCCLGAPVVRGYCCRKRSAVKGALPAAWPVSKSARARLLRPAPASQELICGGQ